MSEEEKQAWEKQISLLQGAREILEEDNKAFFITRFIEYNWEAIYEKYCDVFPERITSDFEFDDIPDVGEFVETYMMDQVYQ